MAKEPTIVPIMAMATVNPRQNSLRSWACAQREIAKPRIDQPHQPDLVAVEHLLQGVDGAGNDRRIEAEDQSAQRRDHRGTKNHAVGEAGRGRGSPGEMIVHGPDLPVVKVRRRIG